MSYAEAKKDIAVSANVKCVMEARGGRLLFLSMAASWASASIFTFFGVCLCIHLLWAIFICPETKGKKLEEFEK